MKGDENLINVSYRLNKMDLSFSLAKGKYGVNHFEIDICECSLAINQYQWLLISR